LAAHELNHQKTEQVAGESLPRKFVKMRILYKQTPFEKAFGIPLYRPFFLSFDFEAINSIHSSIAGKIVVGK